MRRNLTGIEFESIISWFFVFFRSHLPMNVNDESLAILIYSSTRNRSVSWGSSSLFLSFFLSFLLQFLSFFLSFFFFPSFYLFCVCVVFHQYSPSRILFELLWSFRRHPLAFRWLCSHLFHNTNDSLPNTKSSITATQIRRSSRILLTLWLGVFDNSWKYLLILCVNRSADDTSPIRFRLFIANVDSKRRRTSSSIGINQLEAERVGESLHPKNLISHQLKASVRGSKGLLKESEEGRIALTPLENVTGIKKESQSASRESSRISWLIHKEIKSNQIE